MKNTLAHFNTSLRQLQQDERDDKQIEQNHYGDYLMIAEPWTPHADNYKVWLSHPENVRQGQPRWQIEHAGPSNGYRWEIIAEGNN